MPQKAAHGPWAELQPAQQFTFKFINASSSGGGEGDGGGGDGGGDGVKRSDLVDRSYEGDAILQPVPLGAPLPPLNESPHAVIAPDASSAAKALPVEEMLT